MNKALTFPAYHPSLAQDFRNLNLCWIKKYFVVEPADELVLGNPQKYIIDKGGDIFFAQADGKIAGTFALIKIEEEVYELGKMAVDESFQGKKIGNALMEYCIKKAKERRAKKIILYSNTRLAPAIHLYKKFGFTEVPVGTSEYKRSNIKMEKKIHLK